MNLVVGVDYTLGTWKGRPMYICKLCAATGKVSPYSCLHMHMLEEHFKQQHGSLVIQRTLSVPLYDSKGELIVEVDETI